MAGLMFDVGSGRYLAPPRDDPRRALPRGRPIWRSSGRSAASRPHASGALGIPIRHATNTGVAEGPRPRIGLRCLDRLERPQPRLPAAASSVTALPVDAGSPMACQLRNPIRLIDVIWLRRETGRYAAAFEVRHSTSILRHRSHAGPRPGLAAGQWLLPCSSWHRTGGATRWPQQLNRSPPSCAWPSSASGICQHSQLREHREPMARFASRLETAAGHLPQLLWGGRSLPPGQGSLRSSSRRPSTAPTVRAAVGVLASRRPSRAPRAACQEQQRPMALGFAAKGASASAAGTWPSGRSRPRWPCSLSP